MGQLGGAIRWPKLLFLAVFTLASCAPFRLPAPSPAIIVPPVTPTLATVPPTGEPPSPAQASKLAPLFGPAWGDRTVYRRALVTSEQDVLDMLPGASEYRIELSISENFTDVTGRQQVRFTNREGASLDQLIVRLFPNALGGEMSVSDLTVDGVAVQPQYHFARTAVQVPLPQPLRVGESVVLSLSYRIVVPETLEKGYGLISYTKGILALDTPYASIPVFNDEGWNVETPPPYADTSFNDASFYLVRVTAPAEIKLVAAGVTVERETQDGAQRVTFAQGPARDFFIAGSTDTIVTTRQIGETLVNSYARSGDEEASGMALDAAINAVRIFGQRFGPYPYTELDVAATPMLALGIEYPGAVGISERVYAPDADTGSRPQGVVIESTVVHEVAHQWFYNLVGSDQIDEPWLDEALAQYSTWLYYVDRYGEQAADGWRASWESRWDRVGRRAKPVGLTAQEYDEGEYSAIVYGRGPLFISAVAERMGQPTFDRFLRDYAVRFRWDIAATADFKAMAEKTCACELDDLYREWLDP